MRKILQKQKIQKKRLLQKTQQRLKHQTRRQTMLIRLIKMKRKVFSRKRKKIKRTNR